MPDEPPDKDKEPEKKPQVDSWMRNDAARQQFATQKPSSPEKAIKTMKSLPANEQAKLHETYDLGHLTPQTTPKVPKPDDDGQQGRGKGRSR